jgi:hypothetical protein
MHLPSAVQTPMIVTNVRIIVAASVIIDHLSPGRRRDAIQIWSRIGGDEPVLTLA